MARRKNDYKKQVQKEFCPQAGKEKMRFSSKAKAEKYKKDHREWGVIASQTAYWCDACECWHLTHHSANVSSCIQKRMNKQKRDIEQFK